MRTHTPVMDRDEGHRTVTHDALSLSTSFAEARVAVLRVSGDLDMATTPRLAELLWPRLKGELSAIVLDFRALRFLGVAGLELICRAHSYGRHRGIALSIVHECRAVTRALAAGGLDRTVPCFTRFADAHAATSVPSGRRPTHAPG